MRRLRAIALPTLSDREIDSSAGSRPVLIACCAVAALILLFHDPLLAHGDQAKATAKDTDSAVKPSILVWLERNSLRENDACPVRIWISNASDQPITNGELSFQGPAFLNWYKTCGLKEKAIGSVLQVGSIGAWHTVTQDLCLKTQSEIQVGASNVVFALHYYWATKEGIAESFVSAEKTLNTSFFGIDTLAGIPVGLSAFVVPGLFCLLFLELFSVPWASDFDLGERILYGALISVALIAVCSLLKFDVVKRYTDVQTGISVLRLTTLIVAASLAGFFIGLVYWLIRRNALHAKISSRDKENDLLGKMLKDQSCADSLETGQVDHWPKTIVILENNQSFVGSLCVEDGQRVYLIGWFKIDRGTLNKKIIDKLLNYQNTRKFLKLFRLAMGNNAIAESDAIKKIVNGNVEETTGQQRMDWESKAVAIRRTNDGHWPPLRLE